MRTLIGSGFPLVKREELSLIVSGELTDADATHIVTAHEGRVLSPLVVIIVVATFAASAMYVATRTYASSKQRTAAVATRPTAEAVREAPARVTAGVPPEELSASAPAIHVGDGSCRVRIASEPSESQVMVDGRAIGMSPLSIDGVWCGRATNVTVTRGGFVPWQRRIIAEEGRVVEIAAGLRPVQTRISPRTNRKTVVDAKLLEEPLIVEPW